MKVNGVYGRSTEERRVASGETDHHHSFLFRSSSTSGRARLGFLTLQGAEDEACTATLPHGKAVGRIETWTPAVQDYHAGQEGSTS